MRLTLRTLIAWLDDTLSPNEVKTIGQQVAESPFAKELVERVQRVTRQRRLTYPGDLGSEEIDANLVACYLDNALTPEQVADYEKRCLTSDVALAEVASVHQVLSLIGQKAKVPPDARHRMYRLVRGRETTRPGEAAKPRQVPPAPKPRGVAPISAWSDSIPTRRPAIERFGPAAAVLAAIALLGWAAIYSLSPEPTAATLASNRAPKPASKVAPTIDPGSLPIPKATNPAPPPVEAKPKAEPAKAPDPANPEDMGTFEAVQGVVLRGGAEPNSWDRIEAKAPLKARTRLLNLSPFRNLLKLGKDELELVDSTEVVLDDPEKDQSSRLDLKRGQVVLRNGANDSPFALRFEGKTLTIASAPGVLVGLERHPTLLPARAEAAPDRLRVFVTDGRATLKSAQEEVSVDGPGEISFLPSGQFGEKARQPMPSWVTETTPSGFSKEVGDQFVALLRPGRPILSDLVEAMDDPQKDVKRMAVAALGSIGSMEQVVEVVSRKEDPIVRRAGIEALKTGLATGGESAKSVREALVRQFDHPWAEVTEKLIVGFLPEESRDEATVSKLVEYLGTAPSRGTRQLALDNLRTLTGRDSLEYDPDSPEGKGLKAWQEVARKRETSKDARPAGAGLR